RVGEHLAVLGGEQARKVLSMRVEELADPEEELGPPCDRERAPRRERFFRGLDGGVDLLDRREIDRAGLHAGGRVEDDAAAPGLAFADRAADPVVDRPGGGRGVDELGHPGKGSVAGVEAPLLELAEEPGLWLPPEPTHDVVLADGWCLVTYGR